MLATATSIAMAWLTELQIPATVTTLDPTNLKRVSTLPCDMSRIFLTTVANCLALCGTVCILQLQKTQRYH